MTTFVLIPGAGGVGAFWDPLAAELRGRGHESVPLDLPADDPTLGFPEYAQLTVDAVDGRSDLVLVAQSMGGFVVPGVCARLPDAVRMIIFLNAMIPAPGETAGDWWGNTGSAEARRDNDVREGRSADEPFDLDTYFFHDVPAAARARLGPGRDQTETVFAQTAELTAWPPVPMHVLTGRDDRFFPADFQRRVALSRLGVAPDLVPGGHLAALSYPGEIADRLVGYVTPRP
jgi:pimeloyl-ACP methyl ester carboxylesterase